MLKSLCAPLTSGLAKAGERQSPPGPKDDLGFKDSTRIQPGKDPPGKGLPFSRAKKDPSKPFPPSSSSSLSASASKQTKKKVAKEVVAKDIAECFFLEPDGSEGKPISMEELLKEGFKCETPIILKLPHPIKFSGSPESRREPKGYHEIALKAALIRCLKKIGYDVYPDDIMTEDFIATFKDGNYMKLEGDLVVRLKHPYGNHEMILIVQFHGPCHRAPRKILIDAAFRKFIEQCPKPDAVIELVEICFRSNKKNFFTDATDIELLMYLEDLDLNCIIQDSLESHLGVSFPEPRVKKMPFRLV